MWPVSVINQLLIMAVITRGLKTNTGEEKSDQFEYAGHMKE